jgi:alanine dehydrogenase
MKIGIIRESKFPPDTRVALVPQHAQQLLQNFSNISIVAQQSSNRCFTNDEYFANGIGIVENVNDCNFLIGVKEVPIELLVENITYFFFSHTIKKQPYNRKLLQAVIKKNIRLIDYECITDSNGVRVIAFGKYAGIVGAHNGLMTYGERTKSFHLPRCFSFKDVESLYNYYKSIKLPAFKIVVTGAGRVASGVVEVMRQLNIKSVSKEEFINNHFSEAVYFQLDSEDLYFRKDGSKQHVTDFYNYPEKYNCNFEPYYKAADVMINAVFWNPKAPVFFTKEEMKQPNFKIKTIADITCDIDGSIPCTSRATTIAEPVMGYNPVTEKEESPYALHVVDIMSVDNLPNELPRDASTAFSEKMLQIVLPELLKEHSDMIQNATIAANGKLTTKFQYLQDYLEGA